MRTPSPRAVQSLAGRYQFLVVTTAGVSSASRDSAMWDVVLTVPDSARMARARQRPYGRESRTDLRLVGTRRRRETPSSDSVEWNDGVLVFGCPTCSSRPRGLFMIEQFDTERFRGSWLEIPPSIDEAIDPRGPARDDRPRLRTGYFCAFRMNAR